LEEVRTLSRIPGPRGERGLPGKDGETVKGDPGPPGLSIEDFTLEYDGERTFKFTFARGKQAKEFQFVMPVLVYRGVFKESQNYARGDVATYDGSAWHCEKSTTDKPGVGSPDWRLMVKHGRDGKAGAAGAKGDPGQVVRAPAPYVPFSDGKKS